MVTLPRRRSGPWLPLTCDSAPGRHGGSIDGLQGSVLASDGEALLERRLDGNDARSSASRQVFWPPFSCDSAPLSCSDAGAENSRRHAWHLSKSATASSDAAAVVRGDSRLVWRARLDSRHEHAIRVFCYPRDTPAVTKRRGGVLARAAVPGGAPTSLVATEAGQGKGSGAPSSLQSDP